MNLTSINLIFLEQEKCIVDGYYNDFETFDYSDFHIIPENDTHTFINGSLKALLDIKTPWYIHVHTEHYERGKWLLQAFTRTYKDFCPEFKNPLQVWYYITKNYEGCVIPKGVILLILNFNNESFIIIICRISLNMT